MRHHRIGINITLAIGLAAFTLALIVSLWTKDVALWTKIAGSAVLVVQYGACALFARHAWVSYQRGSLPDPAMNRIVTGNQFLAISRQAQQQIEGATAEQEEQQAKLAAL